MAYELSVQALEPNAPSEEEFQALGAALSASARGRAFLAEYARRQRTADTAALLAAVDRLEGMVRAQVEQVPPPAPPTEESSEIEAMRRELHLLLDFIHEVQAEPDTGNPAVQTAKLASLVDVLRGRIATLLGVPVASIAVRAVPEAPDHIEPMAMDGPPAVAMAEIEAEVTAEVTTEVTAEVAFEPPALPEAVTETEPLVETFSFEQVSPAEALADMETVAASAIPEVTWFEGAASALAAVEMPEEEFSARPVTPLAIAAVVEAVEAKAANAEAEAADATAEVAEAAPAELKVLKAGTIPPPTPFAGEDFSSASTAPPAPFVGDDFSDEPEPEISTASHALPSDPFAPIKALSEEERLALFS